MSVHKLAAIAVIFLAACGGWMVLGTSTQMRSQEYTGRLGRAVEELWGVPLVQEPPGFFTEIPGSDRRRWIMPARNDVQVKLATDYRKKGLIWYPTYACDFSGRYTVANEDAVTQKIYVKFNFPAKTGTFDAFSLALDGRQVLAPVDVADGVGEIIELAPGKTAQLDVAYRTRGLREWRYKLSPQIGRVRNLNLCVATTFKNVDYPDGSLSPTSADVGDDGGKVLSWQATDQITKQDIGITIPEKLNPGPLTSRITFFAPVCLLFFFILVATINILYRVNIHPMHYLFVAAGFFSFHLLLSYMAGLVNIHLAFVISAIVSVALVTSYLSAALRGAFPWKIAAAGQLFFLVLFSYSFFFKGITGLTVAIGSVVTLAILMKVTAHLNWDEVFSHAQIVRSRHKDGTVATEHALSSESGN